MAGIGMARDLSDLRLVARGERILGRVRAREGRLKEALSLLSSSVAMLRRSGAQVDAARAALDYVIAAQGVADGNNYQTTQELLGYAIETFDRTRSTRDLQIAQIIAQRVGQEPTAIGR
jgi:hypothetical protein